MPNILNTNKGKVALPAFFPDATRAVIRSLDSQDLENEGVAGLVVNTFHLLNHSLINVIHTHGGLHQFMNWKKPIITDSGGFQVLSIVRQNPKMGTIRPNEIIFHPEGDRSKKVILTPEKVIRTQLRLGSDLLICLDDCTKNGEEPREQEESVNRTINWARRCREEFDRLTEDRKDKPLLFAVVQGGNNKELRQYCTEELLKIGFDGYGYGGWPVNEDGSLDLETLSFVTKLIPDRFYKYGLGIGKPENVVACVELGYTIFDCVIPTRDARHKRLFVFNKPPTPASVREPDFYSHVYMQDISHKSDTRAVSEHCNCHTCQNYTRAYLYHLFRIHDVLSRRLATIHNLHFYQTLMECLQ